MLTLNYFNVRGLAETSRILLAMGCEEFEDVRYPLEVVDMSTGKMVKEEFDDDKEAGKLVKSLNKVPFLNVDGVVIPQSKSIERFLANRFGMMGDTPLESAQIDSICECVRDFKDMYQKVRAVPEDKRPEAMTEWFTITLVERLGLLENLLGPDGFSVGDSVSLSDVVLYCFINQFFDNNEASYNATLATPRLRSIIDAVGSNQKVVSWIETRPKTDF
jgi:glutathione S-transferase